MRFEVVDADEWFTGSERDAFAGVQADEQRRGQARTRGRGKRIDIPPTLTAASRSACSTRACKWSEWLREASSGTTPP